MPRDAQISLPCQDRSTSKQVPYSLLRLNRELEELDEHAPEGHGILKPL